LRMIIAHGDGNYFAEKDTLKTLEGNGQVAFRYRENPNGSVNDIAGIFNKERTVLGMMPHPEDAVEELQGSMDGKLLFDSITRALAA
jgi:phosphoribosylformylglycinamidine synthase subunit PurQ / glutaminase